MTTTLARTPFSVTAFLLGNFAALWGFIIAPIYAIGFGLLLPYVRQHQEVMGQPMILPLELPLIGVLLALGGLALSRSGEREGRTASVLGLVLNAVPMALALAIWVMRMKM